MCLLASVHVCVINDCEELELSCLLCLESKQHLCVFPCEIFDVKILWLMGSKDCGLCLLACVTVLRWAAHVCLLAHLVTACS